MVDVAFTRAQVPSADTVVVIDVLRATSTIGVALASGYERVLVAGDLEQALALRAPGRVIAGELRCERPEGFDLGNSPEETLSPSGSELVIATTNGAPAIHAAASAARGEVYAASLLNLGAMVELLQVVEGDVLLLCAGTDGAPTIEDVYLAGRLSAQLDGARTDAAQIAEAVAAAFPQALDALDASVGGRNLRAVGLDADIDFCAQESIITTVPRLAETVDDVAVVTAMDGAERAPAPLTSAVPGHTEA